jgi:flagellin
MALSLINNTAALNAGNNLTKTNSTLGKSLERLSSGLKVNRGADGPAALVISEKQRAQISGLKTAIDNTNKAVSLVQTGEGALNEINSLLTKARGLALDSANSGVNDADSLAANQAEIRNTLNSITQIATTTQFGSKKLLDGSAGLRATTAADGVSVSASQTAGVEAGTYVLDVTTAAVKATLDSTGAYDASGLTGGATGKITINNVDISLNEQNASTLADAIKTINSYSGQTGVVASADAANPDQLLLTSEKFGDAGNFTLSGDTVGLAATNLDTTALTAGETTTGVDAEGTLDLDGVVSAFVGEGNVIKSQGLEITLGESATAGTSITVTAEDIIVEDNSLTFQIGANAGQTASIGLGDARATALGQNASAGVVSLNDIDVTTAAGAQAAIDVIDKSISQVSNLRGDLGAFQSNTLETNANSLRASLENTVAAESVIRDTDFASEIANFTKQQTLLQAGSTVLGNANQITQLVAGLLRG